RQREEAVALRDTEFDHGDGVATLELCLFSGIQDAAQILWPLDRIPQRLRVDRDRKHPDDLLHQTTKRGFLQKHAKPIHRFLRIREPTRSLLEPSRRVRRVTKRARFLTALLCRVRKIRVTRLGLARAAPTQPE